MLHSFLYILWYIYIYIVKNFGGFFHFLIDFVRNRLNSCGFQAIFDGAARFSPVSASCHADFAKLSSTFCKSRRKQRVLAKTVTGNQKFTPKRCCPRIFSAAYDTFHFPEYHPAAHRTWFLTVYAIRPFLIFGKKYVIIIIEKEIKQVLFQINKFQKEINYGLWILA